MINNIELYQSPSIPNSAVHLTCSTKSSGLTDGFAFFTHFIKSIYEIGGKYIFPGTSNISILILSGSEGEQGVYFSSPSANTFLKN